MTDRILELAAMAGAWTPMGLPSDWQTGDVVFSQNELRAFAALVRRDALEAVAKELGGYAYLEGYDAADIVRTLAAQEES